MDSQEQVWTPEHRPFRTVDEIRDANRRAGDHFFDPDTMRSFQSRVLHGVYAGRFFITSERDRGFHFGGQWAAAWDGERRYTIREALPDGTIGRDGSGFGEYRDARTARRAAQRLADALRADA